MWSAAVTTVNLVGGGGIGEFQFATRITPGKYGPTGGSVTAISVQGKGNCFNVSRLAC